MWLKIEEEDFFNREGTQRGRGERGEDFGFWILNGKRKIF